MAGEIAEFYSYTENPEFPQVQKSFDECMQNYNLPTSWKTMSEEQKETAIRRLLDQTEVTSRADRLSAIRATLYIAQGCWLENQSDSESFENCKKNVELLYRNGVYGSFAELLNLEME